VCHPRGVNRRVPPPQSTSSRCRVTLSGAGCRKSGRATPDESPGALADSWTAVSQLASTGQPTDISISPTKCANRRSDSGSVARFSFGVGRGMVSAQRRTWFRGPTVLAALNRPSRRAGATKWDGFGVESSDRSSNELASHTTFVQQRPKPLSAASTGLHAKSRPQTLSSSTPILRCSRAVGLHSPSGLAMTTT
jgi:hypothetical protein